MVSAVESISNERFVLLDGMRGLAALAVITDHVPSVLSDLMPGRYLAVDFFFVLSGFVLAHVYGERLRAGMSAFTLMRIRLIRLYPLYLAGAGLGAALAIFQISQGWNDFTTLRQIAWAMAFALFMIPCPPPLTWWGSPYALNGPSWSLFFELFSNAIFGALGARLTPKICLALAALGGILLVPTALYFGRLDGGYAWENFIAGFPRVTFSFFIGVWIYQSRVYARVPTLPAWAAFAALVAVFMIPAAGLYRALFDLAAVLLLFPTLVAFAAGSQVRGALMELSAAVGLLSYGVYILHVPLWGWIELALNWTRRDMPGLADLAMTALAALAVVAVLNVIYDKPMRAWLSRRLVSTRNRVAVGR